MSIGECAARSAAVSIAPAVERAPRLPFFSRQVSFVARLVLGRPGSGPRGFRREGFPEHEWQQVISGRRDRFAGM